MKHVWRSFWISCALWRTKALLLLVALASLVGSGQAQEATLDVERLQRATVYIIQAEGSRLLTRCVGSGTIVRPDGLILTNAHNTVTSSTCPGNTLIIAMTLNLGEPPIPKYRAEIVEVDRGLDLALLRITQEFDGRAIEAGTLPNLPFVELGTAADITLDQTVTVVGYVGIGNEAVTPLRAAVRGFVDEPSAGDKSWIKIAGTDPIAGVVSGGGAYDREGRLIGVPTSAPLSLNAGNQQCRYLEDSNQDGLINQRDVCVPLGDFVSVLRPIDFARALVQSASLSLRVEVLSTAAFQTMVSERPSISRLFSAPSVVDNMPSSVVGSVPAGTTSLYLFFDYSNMTPETVYELRVTIDGVPNQIFSLPPVRWSGGTQGMWYIGTNGQPYPNGVYEYSVYIDGVVAGRHRIVIGGPPTASKSFSNVLFGLLDTIGNLQGNGYVLPTGSIATARFIYQGMTGGTPYSVLWYFNRNLIARTDGAWNSEDGESGSYSVSLQPEGGLIPGNYRLELYIEGLLSATGDFVIAGEQTGALPRTFSNLEFIRTASPLENPTGAPASTYPDGANTLYARFDWRLIAAGTRWKLEWLVDNQVFYQSAGVWNVSESGAQFTVRLSAPNGLPDGGYSLRLYVNDILQASANVSVGIGQLNIDRFAQASGVQLRGRIVDAMTGQGIAGVAFILISEDFSVADFVWDANQIYALAVTDRNGRFEIDRPLILESPYSVIVEVEGYLPLSADGFSLTPEDGNPIDLFIELMRD